MNTVMIKDATGRENAMVALHLQDFLDAGLGVLPAFKVNGKTVDTIYISKYVNEIVDGVAHSTRNAEPGANISFDGMVRACEAKGAGWHLMTNAEWAAVALLSKARGTLPHGNTAGGKSHIDESEHGTICRYGKTLAGSGPDTWNHDHTEDGIADLCGNIWEWVAGIRFLDGQLQIIPNNDAAACVDQSKNSALWTPVLHEGKPINYRVSDEEITLTTDKLGESEWDGVRFSELKAEIDVPAILKELALYPDGYDGDDYFYLDTDGERLVYRGGYWNNGAYAGVFSLYASYPRTNVGAGIGGRSAYIPPENLESENLCDGNETEAEPCAECKDSGGKFTAPQLLRAAAVSNIKQAFTVVGVDMKPEFYTAIENASIGELAITMCELTEFLKTLAVLNAVKNI